MTQQHPIFPRKAERFYGRRKGKALTKTLQQRFEDVLPNISIDLSVVPSPLCAKSLFDTPINDIWFEVGFGGGEHLLWQAQHHPHIGFIGCEPFVNGTAKLLRGVEQEKLTNIRIYMDDARHIMDICDDASIGRAFALFGDPWRKYRHRYRRFISPDTLNRFARILKNDAILRVATDHPVYLQWILKHVPIHPDFEWLDKGRNDWLNRPDDWPATRYEHKAIKQGRTPHFLSFKRKPR